MVQEQIDRFFRELDKGVKGITKIKIILTGAAAGILLGGNRPSIDIDFAIICNKKYLKELEDAIKKTSSLTAIAVNYSEDIDRWSQITLLDYRRHTIKYKRFGTVEVTILSPEYWSIGKFARYLDPDVDDLVKVLKNNSVPYLKLARLLGRALLNSPRSSAIFMFRTHVEHFFKTYGSSIWGKAFNENRCLEIFWRSSGIR